MRWIPLLLGVPAAFLVMAVSMGCNWVFFSSLGRTVIEAQMLGGTSVAVDIFKALCPFWIAAAVTTRRWLATAGASAMLILCLSLSFLAAVGFAAGTRGGITNSREGLNARYEGTKRDVEELTSRLKKLPEARLVPMVEQHLNELKQDRRWYSSRQCEDATLVASREFCKGYFQTRGELASAVEAARIAGRLEDLKREVRELRATGAGEAADPQASLVSQFVGMSVARVQSGINLLVAVFLEFGAAFGLYFAVTLGRAHGRLAGRDSPGASLRPDRRIALPARGNEAELAMPALPRKVRLGRMAG